MAPRQPVLKRQKPRGWELETYLMEESKELQTILKVDSNNTSNLCLFQTTQHQRYINTDGLDPSCSGIVARSQKLLPEFSGVTRPTTDVVFDSSHK